MPPHTHRPPPGGNHKFTGLKYSGAFTWCCPYFDVFQFIGLEHSVFSTVVKYYWSSRELD